LTTAQAQKQEFHPRKVKKKVSAHSENKAVSALGCRANKAIRPGVWVNAASPCDAAWQNCEN